MFATTSGDKIEASKQAAGQISIWEKALGLRVHLQKSLDLANKLPVVDLGGSNSNSNSTNSSKKRKSLSHQENNSNDSSNISASRQTLSSTTCDIMSDLVGILDPSTNKKSKFDVSDDPDAIWTRISDVQSSLRQEKWEPVVNKWYSRVNFGNEKSRTQLKVFNKSIFSQIDEVVGDEKIRNQKSRISASDSPRIGFVASATTPTVDLEVYDDRTFYYLLLQSFLQSSNFDPSQSDQIAHLRKVKSKKNEADRKASKGRKLRYKVHQKIQNFMFPIPDNPTSFDRDALFQSLFQ